ncbi:MAG: DegV family EDD domain-containing protein [bacterium]|nr:DegV family EDD domain-containing protein [bacterium]
MKSEQHWDSKMNYDFENAFIAGVERVSAWANLLDDINVFPVADGDTGRNLMISLTPLHTIGKNGKVKLKDRIDKKSKKEKDMEKIIRNLLLYARGNSGNIAARFLSGFLTANSPEDLLTAAKEGRERAWLAVKTPKKGTMLTIFDALVEVLEKDIINEKENWESEVLDHLEKAVLSTPDYLPRLKDAGVVDAGALGIFIYLDGFFNTLVGKKEKFRPIAATFKDMLSISSSFTEDTDENYCVDMVLQIDDNSPEIMDKIAGFGDSALVIQDDNFLKVHLHTDNHDETKKKVESLGNIIEWSTDNITDQVKNFKGKQTDQVIHIVTDAAGSVTREDSQEYGFTLLDSYVSMGDKSIPETYLSPLDLYSAMSKGIKTSTAQASSFERHQHYQGILELHTHVLYLCVGSIYTGNYDVAVDWKKENDPDNRLTVIDSSAASGRLGTLVLAVAHFAKTAKSPEEVIAFAKKAVHQCKEYIFLDKLQYLAAGGRLSKTSAFFGDVLQMKPVISPLAEGAQKVGVVRNQEDQVSFALEKLKGDITPDMSPFILLEYSDNKDRVTDFIKPEIVKLFPNAEIKIQPMSLTTGVHTGPGTWAVAYLPDGFSPVKPVKPVK